MKFMGYSSLFFTIAAMVNLDIYIYALFILF